MAEDKYYDELVEVTMPRKYAIKLKAILSQNPDADVVEMPDGGIGNLSDGYHTFNELYHHRAVLFSVFDGMFIVGIETPEGQATYHYDIEPYWDMFKVKELEKAPKWDGHTPEDAINRIASLSFRKDVTEKKCKNCYHYDACSSCCINSIDEFVEYCELFISKSEVVELAKVKEIIMQYIAEQTVSKYPTAELCKCAKMSAEGVIYALEYALE